MSIMQRIFGSAAPTAIQPSVEAAQHVQQPQPGNIQPQAQQTLATAQSPGTDTNGVIPANSVQQPTTSTVPASPLDAYSDLWKTTTSTNQNQEAIFNVDQQKLMEAAGKVNFSQVVNKDMMAAIAAGGEGAVGAMLEAMNKMSQTVYAQSALATSKIVEQAVQKANERFDASLPAKLKQHQVSEGLRTDNPALNHPAATPVLEGIEQRLVQKHPNATSTEIKAMAQDYFLQLATVFAPKKADPAATSKTSGDDWSKFFE